MYSVVLMAAMTAGNATPGWHHCGGWCGGHHGCYGGCYGGGPAGGYDVYGGCYGCWGGYSNWSFGCAPPLAAASPGSYGLMGGAAVPGMGLGSEELSKPTPNKTRNGEKETRTPAPARLLVEVPSNARLFIDDRPVQVPPGLRTFLTPALEPGQAYFYTLHIERKRQGEPITETRRIIVRAGQVARAEFNERESEPVRTVQAK